MFEKNGVFVNGDTIAVNRKEDKYMAEAEQMYKNENMPLQTSEFHVRLDFEHEKEVLKNAGFNEVELVKEWTNTKLYKK